VGIGCNAAYRFTVSGSMKADFGIAGYMLDINAPELTLGTEQGLYVDLPIQVGFNRLIGVEIKPWFELRPSGISNVGKISSPSLVNPQTGAPVSGSFIEPRSESYSAGCMVSLMVGKFNIAR
jgi:hypothetical protein